MKRIQSMPVMIAIAGALLVGGMFVHPVTAIGQGIGEKDIVSWSGVYLKQAKEFFLAVHYTGQQLREYPIPSLPVSLFSEHGATQWTTPLDDPLFMRAVHAAKPHMVEQLLGTYQNVETFGVIFPASPVGYTTVLLRQLARLDANPAQFGGPAIPPGTVPYARLKSGVLHVDTQVNNNTLTQCQPGQVPITLRAIAPGLRAGAPTTSRGV